MDLLNPTAGNLQVREDMKAGVYIEGITEEITNCSEDAISLLQKGARNRHVGATNMN
jgi:Kinesin motor domain